MSKIFQVTVSPKGETKIETIGFTGSSCQDASRALEAAFGAKTNETLTGDYYATGGEQEVEHQT